MPTWTNPRTWTDGELENGTVLNQHIRDNFLAVPHIIAVKTADESVTSSIVLQNDDHLVLALGATETWHVMFKLLAFGNGTGNLRLQVTVPGSSVYSLGVNSPNSAGTLVAQRLYNTGGASADINVFAATQGTTHILEGWIWTTGTAGNLQLQWAQAISDATATTLKKGSLLLGMKVT